MREVYRRLTVTCVTGSGTRETRRAGDTAGWGRVVVGSIARSRPARMARFAAPLVRRRELNAERSGYQVRGGAARQCDVGGVLPAERVWIPLRGGVPCLD